MGITLPTGIGRVLLRARIEDLQPDPDPEPKVLTLAAGFVLSSADPTQAPGATLTVVEEPQYLLDGVAFVPTLIAREWVSGGVVVGTGDGFTGADGVSVYLRDRVIDPETGLEWTGEPAQTQVYSFTTITPGTKPPAPTPEQWDVVTSYYIPTGQTTTFKPEITLEPALTVAGAEVEWTSSLTFPADPSHWEPLIAYGDDWTTSHKDGPLSTWASFTATQVTRRENQFRIRWRLNGSEWSDESAIKAIPVPPPPVVPAKPTGFTVTPGSTDGQVVIAINPQTDWGDGTAGTLQLSASPFLSPATLVPGNLQMPALAHGLSVTFSVVAKAAEGWTSEPATVTMTVPGDPPALDTSQWARFHFSSTDAYNSWVNSGPDLYRYGKGAREIQFCHGGERSPADPNYAAFWMDVAGPWVCINAESSRPVYQHATCKGIWASLSSAGKWHPTEKKRFVYVAAAQRASGSNEDLGDGLYVTDDLGETLVRKIGRHDNADLNMARAASYVKGGRSDDLKWRNYFHTIDYDPTNTDHWWWANSDDAIYVSTDDWDTWSLLSEIPRTLAMGRIGYMKVLPGGDTIWFGCDTGLWKSGTGGVGATKQSPNGLPSGRITVLDFNPANYDDFYVCVYKVGIYRTTDGGLNFNKIATPFSAVAQIVVSNVNRQHMWLMGVGPENGMRYSNNGGTGWQDCTYDANTYGAAEGNNFYDVMHANRTGDQTQCRVVPSAITASKAIATAACAMWATSNGTTWKKESDGYSNAAGGEGVNFFSAVGNRIACMMFDIRMEVSGNGGKSWRSGVFADLPFYSAVGIACDINPQDPDYVIMSAGRYTTSPSSVVISTDFCTLKSNSFRPSFYASNYGASDRCPWVAWHGQDEDIAYSLRGKSTSKGTNWQKWTAVETSGTTYANEIGEPVISGGVYDMRGVWARSPADGDVLYAFSVTGRKILRSDNAGVSWTKIADRGPGEFGDHIYGFEPHPTDPLVAYWWETGVGLVRWNNGIISVSTGTAPIKHLSCTSLCVNPQNPNHIALMNRESGSFHMPRCAVWLSTSGFNGTYNNITANLPQLIAHKAMAVHPTDNYLFVHGVSGAYTIGLPGGSPSADFFLTHFGAA